MEDKLLIKMKLRKLENYYWMKNNKKKLFKRKKKNI
jgi:hypothetical protein